ncbi:MAG: glycosyltransferase family A protein [Cellvibrionaceae bacterium]
MNIHNPFSKQDRKKKKKAENLARLCEQKALLLCTEYQKNILNSTASGVGNSLDQEIIVSLTSIKPRLDNVAYTIESLMQQTIKADRIILCLGKENIEPSDIPLSLKMLEKRGLEIRLYDEDLGPYTKYFYTLKENPESLIITADDDILYSLDTIEKLYRAYYKENQVIHCHRGHKILVEHKTIMPYKKWDYSSQLENASLSIFPTGVGGVLYFPGCLHQDALNKEKFMKLCPKADDVWLKAMSLKKGISCRTIKRTRPFSFDCPNIPLSQEVTLKRSNKKTNGNDAKVKRVFEEYSLIKKLENA